MSCIEAESESDDEVGAQAPPLTKQISNILNRYPEGGQILKVLALGVTAHNTVILHNDKYVEGYTVAS